MPIEAPTLETDRLILRALDPERDMDEWCEIGADEETMRFIGGASASRGQAWRVMALIIGHWTIRGFGFFAVQEKASGALVGRVGPWRPEGWPGDEVGWLTARPYWGRGYAGEAAEAAMGWAFDTLGWTRIIHTIDPTNTASIRVAEKLGSTATGEETTLPGVGPDGADVPVLVWAQTIDEWRARRRG